MKRVGLWIVLVVMISTAGAKKVEDPIIMTVGSKEIPLSEFIFMAKRDNSGVDLNDKKSVENFAELFKNLKLKVVDAESIGLHQSSDFEQDLNNYKRLLNQNFLADKEGEEAAIRIVYDRMKFLPGFQFILFRFPSEDYFPKDTVDAYKQAKAALQRINEGESFEAVGESLKLNAVSREVVFERMKYLYPMQSMNVLDKVIYNMEPGDIAGPVRSDNGVYLFKMEQLTPNPGTVRAAHIITAFPSETPTPEEIEQTRLKSESIYRLAIAGNDFAELARTYSSDTTNGKVGGLLPSIRLGGNMPESIEQAAFALPDTGAISEPVQTTFGFHVIKLLERKPLASFEEMEPRFYQEMSSKPDQIADLYQSFDERMKVRHQYVIYPEAYAELEQLAETYFPSDSSFYNRGMLLEKPLMRLDTFDFVQYEFVRFLYNNPFSYKKFSLDHLKEAYEHFVRGIVREMEQFVLERDYPEYRLQLNEYYDGTLLFELSNKRIWSYPEEQQAALETEWLKEINTKYPVKINRKVLKNLRKYVN